MWGDKPPSSSLNRGPQMKSFWHRSQGSFFCNAHSLRPPLPWYLPFLLHNAIPRASACSLCPHSPQAGSSAAGYWSAVGGMQLFFIARMSLSRRVPGLSIFCSVLSATYSADKIATAMIHTLQLSVCKARDKMNKLLKVYLCFSQQVYHIR